MEHFVIVYDIPHDGRRTKLDKILDDFGDRIQWSVFEVQAETPDLETLKQRVQGIIDPREDRVRLYPICRSCAEKVKDWGLEGNRPFDEPEVIIV